MNLLTRTAQVWTSALRPRNAPESKEGVALRDASTPDIPASASTVSVCPPLDTRHPTSESFLEADLPDEEVDWIARARQGDVAAFDWLATRYRARAVRLAAHVLRRPSEAEDVAQEAFLRAFTQIRSFRGDAAFYTWLARIVIRLCLNRMRHPGWYRERAPRDEIDYGETPQQQTAEQIDTRLLIDALLDRLSPPLRIALVLREVEGLDYQEIADTLQIPVGTVRSRLNAARTQFRTLWQSVLEETPHA
jgi:RNA polymerase sigma-70 factor (ECF subfamily)